MKKKILIAGSREYDNYEEAEEVLNDFFADAEDALILSGACRGADKIGERYAEMHGFELKRYPADRKRYGRGADPIRNEEMVRDADVIICFWDGKSRGSRNMIKCAERFGKKLYIVNI